MGTGEYFPSNIRITYQVSHLTYPEMNKCKRNQWKKLFVSSELSLCLLFEPLGKTRAQGAFSDFYHFYGRIPCPILLSVGHLCGPLEFSALKVVL